MFPAFTGATRLVARKYTRIAANRVPPLRTSTAIEREHRDACCCRDMSSPGINGHEEVTFLKKGGQTGETCLAAEIHHRDVHGRADLAGIGAIGRAAYDKKRCVINGAQSVNKLDKIFLRPCFKSEGSLDTECDILLVMRELREQGRGRELCLVRNTGKDRPCVHFKPREAAYNRLIGLCLLSCLEIMCYMYDICIEPGHTAHLIIKDTIWSDAYGNPCKPCQ